MSDLIRREDVLNVIQRNAFHEGRQWVFRDKIMKELCNLLAVDAEPVRHAEWLLKHIGAGYYWECSNCHTNPCIYVTNNTKYCPNCGAKMDGGKDDGTEVDQR